MKSQKRQEEKEKIETENVWRWDLQKRGWLMCFTEFGKFLQEMMPTLSKMTFIKL